MKLTIKIESENAAFEWPEQETSRILRAIATEIMSYETSGSCRDTNGNKVGEWSFKP